jgi:hypothetical protein
VPGVGPERSTLSGQRGVVQVEQVGSPWTERTLVFSDVDGRVTAVTPVAGGETVVTVTRSTGGEFTYRLERGATVDARVGDAVVPGQRLGEDARQYRLVESTDSGGRRTTREEIRRLPPDDGWVQRGSESTFRGAVMEAAALRQLEAEAAARIARGEISGIVRIPHSRGGGGFDHVIVEFTGSGRSTQAHIRIIEVKDYPGRSVPLEEFTAITGEGLRANLAILRNDAREARDALRVPGAASPASFVGLDPHQIGAIDRALGPGSGAVSVEVMVGHTTRIGAEGHHASTVMPALRREVDGVLGAGAFRTNEAGAPTSIMQSFADLANADEIAARAARSGP